MVRHTDTIDLPVGTIAVGVDGSPGAETALQAAVDTAVAGHCPLTIVHAVDAAASTQSVLTDARDAAERRAPELDIHLVVRVAHPRDVLVAVSETASMVVVGSRGRGPVLSRLLGSVSLAVIRHAHCPVLIIRPHHPGVVRRGVLVAANGSQESSQILEFGFQQASLRRLPLTVLHVIEHAGDDAEGHALLVAEAMAGLRERHPDVPVRIEMVRGHPDDAVLTAADRMDLLVVGSHRGGPTHRSVTSAVVERASCPVAVVPLDTAVPTSTA